MSIDLDATPDTESEWSKKSYELLVLVMAASDRGKCPSEARNHKSGKMLSEYIDAHLMQGKRLGV